MNIKKLTPGFLKASLLKWEFIMPAVLFPKTFKKFLWDAAVHFNKKSPCYLSEKHWRKQTGVLTKQTASRDCLPRVRMRQLHLTALFGGLTDVLWGRTSPFTLCLKCESYFPVFKPRQIWVFLKKSITQKLKWKKIKTKTKTWPCPAQAQTLT